MPHRKLGKKHALQILGAYHSSINLHGRTWQCPLIAWLVQNAIPEPKLTPVPEQLFPQCFLWKLWRLPSAAESLRVHRKSRMGAAAVQAQHQKQEFYRPGPSREEC